ncbi:PTS sugar transporter subunit IIA [Pusillimonas sp. MFBS29]|uniref:PTS sugar transporter subunit IIA n=1 Tax=Pusillimonas sp. MFBS29 TaxID=2886690 RepID=UPI001D11BF8B|nr:PTS sugar transporter subunit IIA [Pusillimonas sp. MFBS29]MCC2595695.1 PTS sugar transporter subunit IIA [Pusillimonas sp. MFBS29]
MTSIVLVMHEPLGSSFASCSEHVLGEKPDLTVFDVPPDGDPEVLSSELAGILKQTSDGQATLVLCDIFGATPFNIAKRAIKLVSEEGYGAHLITGTNLCMVLKALTERQDNPEQLSKNVQLGAQKGIVNADNECKF